MKTRETLTIGTEVSYKRMSFSGSKAEIKKSTSTVVGFYDVYVCLENGDKMFRQALTIVKSEGSPKEEDSPLQVLEGLITNCTSLKALKGTLRQAIDNGNLDSYEIEALCQTLDFLQR